MWVDVRSMLTKEEIVDIAEKPVKTSIPRDNVIFDERRITRLIHRIEPSQKPAKKKKKHSQDGVQREFISAEERMNYVEEFGPYGMALINDYEREYFRKRREQIFDSEEFDLDPEFDMNLVMMVIMDEIIQQRFLEEMSITPTNKTLNQQVTEIQKRYRENLKVLDATREQRKAGVKEDKLDSLAAAVMALHRDKQQRMIDLAVYQEEERELIKKIASKAPPEMDYFSDEKEDESDYDDSDTEEE